MFSTILLEILRGIILYRSILSLSRILFKFFEENAAGDNYNYLEIPNNSVRVNPHRFWSGGDGDGYIWLVHQCRYNPAEIVLRWTFLTSRHYLVQTSCFISFKITQHTTYIHSCRSAAIQMNENRNFLIAAGSPIYCILKQTFV